MTGFVCQKHERYCHDGVCPYCEPPPEQVPPVPPFKFHGIDVVSDPTLGPNEVRFRKPLPAIAVETRKNPSLPETIKAEPVPGPITRSILDLLDRYPTAFRGKPAPVSVVRVIVDEANEILDALDPLHDSATCPTCRSFLPLLLEQAT